jgi:hypothetical protein
MTCAVFDSIRYGPFKADYHRTVVDESFRSILVAYLSAELLPQVTVGSEHFEGQLQASYDEDRYCGPRSLVRDIYKLTAAFVRGSERESLDQEIVYCQTSHTFRPRKGNRLRLWTLSRQAKAKARLEVIQATIRQVAKDHLRAAKCPLCNADLHILDTADLFGVVCSKGCFDHDYHRDQQTGEFLHGHLFVKDPE